MMKKNKLVTLILLIVMAIPIGLLISNRLYHPEVRLIEKEYNIYFPDGMTLVYKKDTVSWFGEGKRYYVFQLNEEPTSFLLHFSKKKSLILQESLEDEIKRMEVPMEYHPNWRGYYNWKIMEKRGRLYIIYYPEDKRMIIFQIRE